METIFGGPAQALRDTSSGWDVRADSLNLRDLAAGKSKQAEACSIEILTTPSKY
jgi:hypothetical protein